MPDHSRRIARHNGVRRHIARYHAVGANGGVIAYDNRAEKLGAGTDVDVIPDHRDPRALPPPAADDPELLFQLGTLEYRAKRPQEALVHWKRSDELLRNDARPTLRLTPFALSEMRRAQGHETVETDL